MNKDRFKKGIVFTLLAAGVLQAGIMAYSAASNQAFSKYTEEASYTNTQNADAADVTVQEVQIPKKDIDISKVILRKEVEDKITSLDSANAGRNIENYRTLLAVLEVPESFQKEIEEMYNKGHNVQDVLIAYEFLYQNYGSIIELEGLITQKEAGKAWNGIFKDYMKNKEEFQPSNFKGGKLEEIFKMPGITPDDVIIADRTAKQTGMAFEVLIDMRGGGISWKDINEGLEIVNTSGELPRTAVTNVQVNNYVKSTGLSEEKIIEALVLAQKLDKDGKTIVDKVKAGKAEEDILAESLEEKYQ